MTTDTITSADRIAMLLGGGLIVLGVVVLGFINVIMGAPHVPHEVEETGEMIYPVISADIRAYLIALGLLVWFGSGIYKITKEPAVGAPESAGTPAD